MKNPFNFQTGKPVTEHSHSRLVKLWEARINARKAARSGHPGRRAEAERSLPVIQDEIDKVYAGEVR